jgi:hypothetical protein
MSTYWQTMVRSAFQDRTEQLDRETVRAAAWELRQRGLTNRDVGAALRLSEAAVQALLELPA